MISIRSVAVVMVAAGLASVASIDSAFAEEAKVTKTATKLDARGELLVKLAGTELPAGLDAKAHASLKPIVAKLAKDDVDGALADWKKFVQAQGKKLGKPGIERVGHWLVRSAVLEPASELADPADRVRFAREAKTKAQAAIAHLSTAKAKAEKSKTPVSVKLVKLGAYQKNKPATSETAVNLTSNQLAVEIAKLKTQSGFDERDGPDGEFAPADGHGSPFQAPEHDLERPEEVIRHLGRHCGEHEVIR